MLVKGATEVITGYGDVDANGSEWSDPTQCNKLKPNVFEIKNHLSNLACWK